MTFPAIRRDMESEGYNFVAAKTCPCGASIELWLTPKNKTMPMQPMQDDNDPAIPHWGICPMASAFRKPRSAAAAGNEQGPGQTQPDKPAGAAADKSQ